MASVNAATTAAMDAMNVGVATVWHNQQQLEAEARTLQAQTQRFQKQSSQWLATFRGFDRALKSLGDVENWARTMEADMAFINSSLEQIQQGREQEAARSSASGSAAPSETE